MCMPEETFHLIPERFKTQEMWIKAVEVDPCWLADVPDKIETHEMCDKAVHIEPLLLAYIPDSIKTPEMRNEAVEKAPWLLYDVPVHLRTQEICDKVVSMHQDVSKKTRKKKQKNCFWPFDMLRLKMY